MCYLIGAMDRVTDGGVEWRDDIIPHLRARDILVFNPCDKPMDFGNEGMDARAEREKLVELGEYDEVRKEVGLLRAADMRFTDKSDFIIFRLDPKIHLCGSYNEAFISNLCKKPVLVWVVGGKKMTPRWMFAVLPHQHIFGERDDLLEYIRHVDEDEEVYHYKRWTFIDYNRLFAQNDCEMKRTIVGLSRQAAILGNGGTIDEILGENNV